MTTPPSRVPQLSRPCRAPAVEAPFTSDEHVWQALVPAYLLLVGFAVVQAGSAGGRLAAALACASLATHVAGLRFPRRFTGHLGAACLLLVATTGLMGGHPLLVVLAGALLPLVVYVALPIDEAVGWGVAMVLGILAFAIRIGLLADDAQATTLALTGVVVAGVAATALLILIGARAERDRLQQRLDKAHSALDAGAERIGTVLGDRDAALHASRSKDEFLSLLSFELRTPLTTIVGHSEMLAELLDELDADEGAGDARAIRRSSSNLISVVDSVLDLARLEEGEVEVRTHPVDPAAIVAFTAEEAAQAFDATPATLELDRGDPIGLVLTDGARLGQLVRVLVTRATKRNRGPEPVRIGLGFSDDRTEIVLRVTDSSTCTPGLDGPRVGLEMRYARALCKVLGGTMRQGPTPGEASEGTELRVSIPVVPAVSRPRTLKLDQPTAAHRSGAGTDTGRLRLLA